MTTKVNIERKILTIFILAVLGMMIFTKNVSAQTRTFTFHMDTSYLHGSGKYNKGYPADKGNNNPYATVDLNWFDVTSGSPTISMWAADSGTVTDWSQAWSFTGTAVKHLYYNPPQPTTANNLWLVAEQFGSGSAIVAGIWEP